MYEDDEIEQLDVTKLKYVLYTRKSTDDPKRQVRSTDDQKAECKQLAERLGIRIVKTIKEDRSAKIPGNRPKFDDMMKGIKAGKYNGILAWNPDRLARNVIEGSDIMAQLDSGKIQDLKFVTHYFTNNASGKMLLGISFVMADYYSRNLSENVSRGVRRGFSEGKSSGTPKHGYIRDEEGRYRPDNLNGSKNFDLIREAWQLRQAGKSLEVIAKHMNESGYGRLYKEKADKAGQKVLMSDKILSDRVFPDPFYYGILIQKNKRVDLRDVPGYDFEPATDEPTYNAIQALTGRRAPTERKNAVFKPLKRMVICAYCQKPMIPQTPTSGRKSEKVKILSYRCDTEYCPRHKEEFRLAKSVRAKVIFDHMAETLSHLEASEADYSRLQAKLEQRNQAAVQSASLELHRKQAALKNVTGDIKDRSLKLLNIPQGTPDKQNEQYVNELDAQRQQLEDDITSLKERRSVPQQDALTFEEFLNVAKNASQLLKAADVAAKDRIARIIYLNVVVDDQNVVEYQMREPFETLLKSQKILLGRGDRT